MVIKITEEVVEYIANLARISLSNEEKEKFTSELNKIINYMDKLNKLDTTNVVPTTHVLPLKNIFREDEVKPFAETNNILNNAPNREGNYFKVKRVIE